MKDSGLRFGFGGLSFKSLIGSGRWLHTGLLTGWFGFRVVKLTRSATWVLRANGLNPKTFSL